MEACSLVSVVVPCFNQGHFLRAAVESVLGGTYPRVEVVVVDDGSTDDTAAVAREYGSAVQYLFQANAGLPAARNRGIRAARGEFVHFLDADDFVTPELYERVMAAASAAPDVDCFHFGWYDVTMRGAGLQKHPAVPLSDDSFAALLQANRFPCHAAVARLKSVRRVGSFRDSLQACEDWDLWLRMAAAGARFQSVPEAFVMYRRYSGSMSTNYRRMWNAGRQVLRDMEATLPASSHYRAEARAGLKWWRQYCFKRLALGMRNSEWRVRVRSAGAALREDPVLIGNFMRLAARLLRRRFFPSVPVQR